LNLTPSATLRGDLKLQSQIKGQVSSNPTFPSGAIRGRLFVKMANIGRRVVTIEKICLQVFQEELEELRKINLAISKGLKALGLSLAFRSHVQRFPYSWMKTSR
jgi:hypothetical protein